MPKIVDHDVRRVDIARAAFRAIRKKSVARATIRDIAREVLAAFRGAEAAQLPLSELVVNFPSLKITARDLRGGAVIFLSPKALYAPGGQR